MPCGACHGLLCRVTVRREHALWSGIRVKASRVFSEGLAKGRARCHSGCGLLWGLGPSSKHAHIDRYTDTHRHAATHTDTHRHTSTHRDTQRDTETHTGTHTDTQTLPSLQTNALCIPFLCGGLRLDTQLKNPHLTQPFKDLVTPLPQGSWW